MIWSFRTLLVLLAIIALFVALIDRRKHSWLWLPLGLVIAAFLLPPLWIQSQYRTSLGSSAAVPSSDPHQMIPSPPPMPQAIAVAPLEQNTDDTAKPTDRTDKTPRPDWMNQPPSKHGDVYIVPIDSGVYADPSVREQMLEAKIAAAANRYIDEVLYRQGGVADAITLDPEYLKSFVRAKTNSSDNNETFVRLEFDQHFRDEIDHYYKSFLSLGRLQQLGGVAAGALLLLGALYSYLKFTGPRTPSAAAPVQTTT